MATTAARLLLGDEPRQVKRRDEIDDLLDQLRRGVEPQEPSPPPVSPPSFMQRVGGALSSAATFTGEQFNRSPGASIRTLRGAGEAIVSTTGAVGGFFASLGLLGSDVLNQAMRQVAERGPVTARSPRDLLLAAPEGFYTQARKNLQETMHAMTYEPKEPSGQALMQAVAFIPGLIMGGSEAAKKGLVALGASENDADALALNMELLGFLALGAATPKIISKTKSSFNKVRNAFNRMHTDADLLAPEVVAAARKVASEIRSRPEIEAELRATRQNLVDTIGRSDIPEILAASKQRLSDLQRGVQQELFPQQVQGELPLRPGGPPVVPPIPKPSGRGTQLEARFPEEGLFSPSGRVGTEFVRPPATPTPPRELTVGYFTDPNIPDVLKVQALEEVSAARGGTVPEAPLRGTVGWFNDPNVPYGQKQVELNRILATRERLPDTAIGTSFVESLRNDITRALDPNVPIGVRTELLASIKAQLREGRPANEPIRKTMQDLGFTVDEIAELEGPLRNVRAKKPQVSKIETPGDVPVVTTPDIPVVDIIPEVIDPVPAIVKPKRARAPRKVVKVDEPVADQVVSDVPTTVPPSTKVPATPPVPPTTPTSVALRVNYYPTTGADISRIARERILASDEPNIPPSGPLSLRYTEGKPDAIMVDPSSFNAVTSLADIRTQVEKGRLLPDLAQAVENKLRQQAEFFGVPIEQAHLYAGEAFMQRMTQLAGELKYELYRARRTRTGIEYEQVAPEAISAANKLDKSSPLAPSKMTPDEASILVEEKTKPVGSPLKDEILQAIDTGDVTILDRVPAELRDFVDTSIKEARKAADTSEVRRLKDIFIDVLDAMLPDNPPPGQLNILAQYSLTPERKAAARRLYADLQRVGRSFRDTLRREGVPEPTITLMERYIQEFKDPLPPARVTPANGFRLGEQQAGEPVRHVRTVRRDGIDYDQPPVYTSEIAMMQRPGDLPVKRGLSSLGTEESAIIPPKASALVPQFALRAGKVPELKHAADAAARAGEREYNSFARDLNAMAKIHDIRSQEHMGEFGYSHTLQGMEILIENGRDIPSLTRNEQITYNALRDLFDNMWLRVNEVREAAGKEPLPYMSDYVPFMRMMSMSDKLGKRVNLFADTARYIKEQVNQYSNLQMPREKLRTGATYTADFNIFHLAQDFMQQALPQIHLAPFLYKLEELAFHALPNPRTGKVDWLLSEQKPRLHAYLRDWHEFLVSGTEPFKSPFWNKTGQFLLKSTSRSMIAYSATTAMVQPTVMINAYHNLGRSALTRGTLDAIAGMPGFFSDPYGTLRGEPSRVQQLYKNSGVLDTRGMQEVFSDVAAAITAIRPRDFMQLMKRGEVGQIMAALDRSVGYKMVMLTDHSSATITGLGAMRLADRINANATRRYGEPLLKGQDYWDFVDDIITRTNAGTNPVDVAPIQRHMGGRLLTHMQRFVINDWNYFIEDVLKATSRKDIAQLLDKDPNKYLPAVVKSILAFTTATAIYNFIQEDILGIRASGGRPLDAARKGIEAGDSALEIARSVAGELSERLPVVGSTKYSSRFGGVVGELVGQSFDAASERLGAYKFYKPGDDAIEVVERIYGSPVAKLLGLRGASTVTRHMHAQDRNAGFWPSITGMTEDTPRQTSSGGRGVGGLRRVR